MPTNRTTAYSNSKERTGIPRLYRRVLKHTISFCYQYPNGTSETFATAPKGDKKAVLEAERIAKRRALDVQAGTIVSGSIADAIDRFQKEVDPKHYLDQSKDGKAVRKGQYNRLIQYFGSMQPESLKARHGYSYLDERAKAGAPMLANKEMALMSTMSNYWVRWGLIDANPFTGLMQNKGDKKVRTVSRRQIVRFYLWSQKQDKPAIKVFGCAALFCYLTGFRAAEVRPFHASGLTDEGVRVTAAKRKKGEDAVIKLREWSPKLRTVVKRAQQAYGRERLYLFGNRHGKPYSRSGWGSSWQDAMRAYLTDLEGRAVEESELVEHPAYFSLLDLRPAAITTKITKRSADMYDFAAHANPATTHRHYDRRKVKKAKATE